MPMDMTSIRALRFSTRGALAIGLVALAGACTSSTTPKQSGDGGSTGPVAWRAAVGAGGTLVQTFDDQTWAPRVIQGAVKY